MEIEVRLYGKLREGRGCGDAASECVIMTTVSDGATIAHVLARLGIAPEHTSNLFLNGELSALTRRVGAGDRLGVFPDNMAILYRWYFARKE